MDKEPAPGIDKRKFKRLKIEFTVKVAFEIEGKKHLLHLKSRNISQQGICLEATPDQAKTLNISSNSKYFKNTPLELELILPHQNIPLTMNGKACWYDITREKEQLNYQISIVFVEPGQKKDRILEDFIKKYSENKGFLKRLFSLK